MDHVFVSSFEPYKRETEVLLSQSLGQPQTGLTRLPGRCKLDTGLVSDTIIIILLFFRVRLLDSSLVYILLITKSMTGDPLFLPTLRCSFVFGVPSFTYSVIFAVSLLNTVLVFYPMVLYNTCTSFQ